MTEKIGTVERTFDAQLSCVRDARRFVRTYARQWSFSTGRLADIELAASELATNAIVHGSGGTFSVSMKSEDDGFVLTVESSGAHTLPQIKRPMPGDRSGRGLLIVSQLGDEFSALGTRAGITMCCTFRQ